MNKQFYLFTVGILWVNILFAQTNLGARLTAMGNNGAAVKDIWGVAANPAAIGNVPHPTLQITHQEHFFTKAVSNQALALAFPINRQIIGLNLQRYGISEFQNIKAGLVITRQFGKKLAIGLRANYHQLKISNYGTTTGISIDVGTIYQFTDDLCFGFYINNPSKETYRNKSLYITIPTAIYLGIAYRTSNKLLVASTMSTDALAIGVDYQFIKSFSLRGGLSLNPFTHYFGMGFSKSTFLTDFSFTKYPSFGYSPQLTIGYVF
ncbi:MAG: hypothetical protein H7202_03955 [Pedobacter sp.]|nr:hypothetical protein [Pedobacter sp.]